MIMRCHLSYYWYSSGVGGIIQCDLKILQDSLSPDNPLVQGHHSRVQLKLLLVIASHVHLNNTFNHR